MYSAISALYRSLRSTVNILILLSALVIAPLFIAAQFLPLLQGFINNIAESYLPNPTVSTVERRKRMQAEADTRKGKQRNGKLQRDVKDLRATNSHLVSSNTDLKSTNSRLKHENRVMIDDLSRKQKLVIKKSNRVSGTGWKIVKRGTTALGVGWIPYAGGAYDLYSLHEDYSDVCDLLQTVDELSGLFLVESHLYTNNYCDERDRALDRLRK